MNILDRIINVVKTQGAITLQEIYKALPDLKETVIRGTLNRYIRKENKKIDRLVRGLYIYLHKEVNDKILEFKPTLKRTRSVIINKFKYLLLDNKKSLKKYPYMVAGLEGQLSFDEIDISNFTECKEDIDIYQPYNQSSHSNTLRMDFKKEFNDINPDSIKLELEKQYPIEYFDNKIFNEDSRDFLKKIENDSIDLVVTDPPYPTTKRGIGKRTNMGGMMMSNLTSSGKIFEHNSIKISEYMPELFRVLKDGAHCYIMTNHKNLVEMLNTAVNCGFKFIKSLIWAKNNKTSGQFYMSQYEYILFFRKGKAKRINNCGTSDLLFFDNKKTRAPQTDKDGNIILDDKGKVKYKNLHDTEKPVELMKVLVENSTISNLDRVLDPFAGIGSLALACLELGRKFICNEIDKIYRNIAKARVDEIVTL